LYLFVDSSSFLCTPARSMQFPNDGLHARASSWLLLLLPPRLRDVSNSSSSCIRFVSITLSSPRPAVSLFAFFFFSFLALPQCASPVLRHCMRKSRSGTAGRVCHQPPQLRGPLPPRKRAPAPGPSPKNPLSAANRWAVVPSVSPLPAIAPVRTLSNQRRLLSAAPPTNLTGGFRPFIFCCPVADAVRKRKTPCPISRAA